MGQDAGIEELHYATVVVTQMKNKVLRANECNQVDMTHLQDWELSLERPREVGSLEQSFSFRESV